MIGRFKTQKCKDCVPNIITYNSIIDCCVRCGEMQKATEIFQNMQVKNSDVAPEEEKEDGEPTISYVMPDLITFSTLIKGHCRVKNIE